MINSLSVGKAIYNLLKDYTTYPLVADNNAKYPFIVYKRSNLISNGCKDGYYEDMVDIAITIVTQKYAEGIDMANSVRQILEKQKIETEICTLHNTYLCSATESFTDNVYVQNLVFRTNITD